MKVIKQLHQEIDECKWVLNWWINGQNQIGGNLDLFFKIGKERIIELYNVEK